MDRLNAWNFKGRACPACGFPGALLYKETCDCCGLSLLECPKCRHVECTGGSASTGARRMEIQPQELTTGLKIVTKAERKRFALMEKAGIS